MRQREQFLNGTSAHYRLFSAIKLEVTKSSETERDTFNGPFSGTTRVSRYQKGKTNLDFTEARDSEWQWHQLGHMQVWTLLQTDNHASSPPLTRANKNEKGSVKPRLES